MNSHMFQKILTHLCFGMKMFFCFKGFLLFLFNSCSCLLLRVSISGFSQISFIPQKPESIIPQNYENFKLQTSITIKTVL